MSRTPAELSDKLVKVARALPDNRAAINAAALAVKDVTTPLVRAATGGDMKLSGVGRKGGAKVGVRYDVKGTRNATAIVKATGPAHLVERDVKPHPVASRYAPRKIGRTRAARLQGIAAGGATGVGWNRRAVISFNGREGKAFARYAVNSGGSKGRHPFERGFAKGARISPEVYAKANRRQIAVALR